jgi:aminopeptidase N
MGINETKYAFMDEGWADMLPFDFQDRMVEGNDQRSIHILRYQLNAGTENDMPLAVPSIQLRGAAYTISAYSRPGTAYDLLRDVLGDELFLKAMHSIIKRWNGKHPIPYDFYNTFNEATGMNLNWYWKPWFFEFGYPDLSIGKVTEDDNYVYVTIKKEGNIPIPVKLTFYYDDDTESEIYKNASVWKDGKDEIIVTEIKKKFLQQIILGDTHIPDVNSINNIYIVEE